MDQTEAQRGVVGDAQGIDLPQTQVDQTQLANEKNMARFSKSKEFKVLKEHLDKRIEFYQTFLPDGREVGIDANIVTPEDWRVANRVIGEFKAIKAAYELAETAVKEQK